MFAPRSTVAASRRISVSLNPLAGTIATTFGLPSVSVPVLSTTSVSTFSMRSSASAFLISTPACAPRPTPTIIDIGVARPSAQGQAMMSTLTAATRPNAMRGSTTRPKAERDSAPRYDCTTAGNLIARRGIGASNARIRHHLDALGGSVSRQTSRAPHDPPAW